MSKIVAADEASIAEAAKKSEKLAAAEKKLPRDSRGTNS